jgi:hypothetical protein
MKRKILFVLFSVFLTANVVLAQSPVKTITNADLEKFRQERLQGEKELRENYRELGFLSPEEQAKQDEQDAIERSELAERLSQERLEREQADSQYIVETQYYDSGAYYTPGYYRPYIYSSGYPYYPNNNYRRVKRGNNWFRELRGTRRGGNYYPPIRIYLNERGSQFNNRNRNPSIYSRPVHNRRNH